MGETEKAQYYARSEIKQKEYQAQVDAKPKVPKRPKNAFMMYSMERRPEINAANKLKPKEHQLKMGDIQKILGAQWQGMTEEQKLPYRSMVKNDAERYKVQLAAYAELKAKLDAQEAEAKKLAKSSGVSGAGVSK